MASTAQFDQDIRRLAGTMDHSRPFICDGQPFGCDVALVGINPATDTPFWPHWHPESGFDRKAWIQDYRRRHTGKRTPTRDRIEHLVKAVAPLRLVELNLYHSPSRSASELSNDKRNTELFEYLLQTLQPRALIVHGRDPRLHLERLLKHPLPLDQVIAVAHQGRIIQVLAAQKHFAYLPGSFSGIDRIAQRILETCHDGSTPVPQTNSAIANSTLQTGQGDSMEHVWLTLKNADPVLQRWTTTGANGKPFRFAIRDAGSGEGIAFIREGREVKSASFKRFNDFYAAWKAGQRTPDQFRNAGEKATKAEVIHFLLAVFEWLESQSVH